MSDSAEETTNVADEMVEEEEKDEGGFWWWIKPMVCAVVVVLIIRIFIMEMFKVPTGSMEETIMTGDMVLTEKVTAHFTGPKQGDVVVFTNPAMGTLNPRALKWARRWSTTSRVRAMSPPTKTFAFSMPCSGTSSTTRACLA